MSFDRQYQSGISVALTAPATAGGNNFLRWRKGNVFHDSDRATSVDIDADMTLTADYLEAFACGGGLALPDEVAVNATTGVIRLKATTAGSTGDIYIPSEVQAFLSPQVVSGDISLRFSKVQLKYCTVALLKASDLASCFMTGWAFRFRRHSGDVAPGDEVGVYNHTAFSGSFINEGSAFTGVATDDYRIDIAGSVVKFYQNNVLLQTSANSYDGSDLRLLILLEEKLSEVYVDSLQ